MRFWKIIAGRFRSHDLDRDLDREISSYLQLEAEEQQEAGLTPEESRFAARRSLGNIAMLKEEVHSMGRWVWLERLCQDLKYAARVLAKSPVFTTVAVTSIAMGIGVNTAIFSVCNAVLLKPLPYKDPNRLVMIWENDLRDKSLGPVAPANFVDWHDQARSFSQLAAINPFPEFTLTGSAQPERVAGCSVSANFFSMLGTNMTMGRIFLPEEDRPGGNAVVILSHGLWRRRFGARADIVGEKITLNDQSFTVVGVLPAEFQFVSKASDLQGRNQFDIWLPLALNLSKLQRGTHPLRVFGRLRQGVSLDQAQAEMDAISGGLQRAYPEDRYRTAAVVRLDEQVTGSSRKPLLILLAAVMLLLLIACANVAALLLSRAVARQREVGLRVALGASRIRLAQQFLTESLLLAISGGAVGLSASWLATRVLTRILPTDVPRIQELALDIRVLAFTTFVSFGAGIFFGLIPLTQIPWKNAGNSLRDSGRITGTGIQSRLRSAFVIGETALAVILTIAAGVMARSLWRLLNVSTGFRTQNVLTLRLALPASRYSDPAREAALSERLIEQLKRLPGTLSAGVAAYLPFSGTDNSWSFIIEGQPQPAAGESFTAKYRPVSHGYFETMGIALREGRTFNIADNTLAVPAVVINESMARKYWNGDSALGKRILFEAPPWRTIVGVVDDVHHEGLDTASKPEFYVPLGQVPYADSSITVILRTSTAPLESLPAVRNAITRLDPELPVSHVETLNQLVSASVGQPRFRALLLGAFAILALIMAALGIYGVISFLVVQRRRELGIRLALGGQPLDVLLMVLRQAVSLVGLGVGLGLLGSAFTQRLVSSLLFATSYWDGPTMAGTCALLMVIALLAALLPARRASHIDPVIALRYE